MNEFEKVVSEVSGECDYATSSEYAIEWIRGDKFAVVTFPIGRYNNRVRKLAEEYPDEVTIKRVNADNSIVAVIPSKWVKISPPPKYSEEYLAANRERLKELRERKCKYDENLSSDE